LSGEPADKIRGNIVAWLLALAPAAMLVVLMLRPVWDVDIFWQLKLGELILAKGGPLEGEPFAATHLGQPLPAFAWLGQAVMAAVRLVTGWTGLRVFDALCWLGGFFAISWACRRRSCSAAGVLLALAIAFLAALPAASLRPQSFAALCFGLLLALVRLELKPSRMLLCAVPLLLAWQNLHPSVSVAAVALGARAGDGWWRFLRRQGSLPWMMTLLALVACAMIQATPDGAAILHLAAENARASAAMGVSEWLPLWDSINRFAAVPVLLVVVVTSWVLLRNPRRIDSAELACAIALFAMTLFAYRFVLFWAISLVPILARAVPPPPIERRLPAWLAALGLLLAAIATPFLRPTYFVETIPLAAIGRLRATGVKGTIFAHFPWGGPAIDAGYPEWKVAFDGRYYRYSPQEWNNYRDMSSGAISLSEIDRRYRPVAFVLSPRWNAMLIARLRADPQEWQQIYEDQTATVFGHRTAATP
jgi:hypothetical protein